MDATVINSEPITLGHKVYYNASELVKAYPNYFSDCKTVRKIPTIKKLEEQYFIYAYPKKDTWISSSKKYTKASILIDKKWAVDNIPFDDSLILESKETSIKRRKRAKITKKPSSFNKLEYNEAVKLSGKSKKPDKKAKRTIKAKKSARKSKKAIPKKIKQLVWNNYIGEKNGAGLCQCCNKTEIKQMDFHCGHVISEKNGGEIVVKNLKPICSLCNSSMGSKNMDEFMKEFGLG